MSALCRQIVGMLVALAASPAQAHSFGPTYTLPLPFWMYAWGATATLLLSFVVVSWFLTRPVSPHNAPGRPLLALHGLCRRPAVWLGRGLVLGLLVLAVTAGWLGPRRAEQNLAMNLFWVWYLLGWAYLTAVVGDLHRGLNPWAFLPALLHRLSPHLGRGWIRLPSWCGLVFASGLLLTLVWLELFGRITPRLLAQGLLAYSGLCVLGALLCGRRWWFAHAEVFGLLFAQLGALAPVQWRALRGQPQLYAPGQWAERHPVLSWGLVLFILTWLASTAFDGLHQSLLWHRWFFGDLYSLLLHQWTGRNPLAAWPQMRIWFGYWQTAWLVLLPLLYVLSYALACALSARLGGGPLATTTIARAFAPSLLPIALVYHVAHYYPLLQSQGVKLIAQISDPLGYGWNLFGTANWLQRTIIPDPQTVWQWQLILIVGGHVLGVVMAHRIALRCFGHNHRAWRSQLPMLVLMIGLTVLGLWILSLPPA